MLKNVSENVQKMWHRKSENVKKKWQKLLKCKYTKNVTKTVKMEIYKKCVHNFIDVLGLGFCINKGSKKKMSECSNGDKQLIYFKSWNDI